MLPATRMRCHTLAGSSSRPNSPVALFFEKIAAFEVPLNDDSRRAAAGVLGEIDRGVEHGFLPAAPGEGECRWCDYRLVCGPDEEARIKRKHPRRMVSLNRLRGMP